MVRRRGTWLALPYVAVTAPDNSFSQLHSRRHTRRAYGLSLPSRSLDTIIAFRLSCPVLTWLFAPDCPRTSQPSPLFTRCASRVTSVKLAAILLSQAVAHSRRGPAIGVQVQSTIMPDKIVRITKLSSAEGRAVCASCSVNAPNVVDTLDLEDLDKLVLSTRSRECVSKPGSAQ